MFRSNKIKEHIKRFKKYDFDTEQYIISHYIRGDKAVIPIEFQTIDELFSTYHPRDRAIHPDIVSYIEHIVYYIPYEYSVVLELVGPSLTEEEKIHITTVLYDHFGLQAHDKKVDLKFNMHKAFILFFFGFAFLYLSYLLSSHSEWKFLNDVISIAGTFSIWELVNTLWLERSQIHISSLNAGQLATSTIRFITHS